MPNVIGYLVIAIGVLAVIGIVYESKTGPATVSPAIDPDRIVPTAALKTEAEEAIRAAGYVCPSANKFRSLGLGVRGSIIQVWCGPAGSTALHDKLVYRWELHPDGSTRLRPWEGNPYSRPAASRPSGGGGKAVPA